VAEEPGVHGFIHRATADQGVVEEARSMTRTLLQGQPLSTQCAELCRRHGVPEPLLRARLWAVASLFPDQTLSAGDPYEILGVEPTADAETVKSAFRRLCLQCHPDLNQDDPQAATRFQQLKSAYDMVSEPPASVVLGSGDGTGVWVEPPREEPRPSAWRRMRHLVPLGLVVAFLVLAVSFADLLIQRPRSRSLPRDAASVMGSGGNQASSVAEADASKPLSLPPASDGGAAEVAIGDQGASAAGGLNASSDLAARQEASGEANMTTGSADGLPEKTEVVAGEASSPVSDVGSDLASLQQPQQVGVIRIEPASRPAAGIAAGSLQVEKSPGAAISAPKTEIEAGQAARETLPSDHAATAKTGPARQAAASQRAGVSETQSRRPESPRPPAASRQGVSSVAEAPDPQPERTHMADESKRRQAGTGSSGALSGSATDTPGIGTEIAGARKKAAAEVPERGDGPAREQKNETGSGRSRDVPSGNGAGGALAAEMKTDPGRSDSLVAAAPVVDVAVVEARLMRFLDSYAADYSRRDLFAFMAHFTPQARENSKPVKLLLPAYQENFREITAMEYAIELDRWTIHDEGVFLEGSFRLAGTYADGRSFSSNGNLSMDLVPSGDTYRVRNLTYSFR
jgi:hypothetical protein